MKPKQSKHQEEFLRIIAHEFQTPLSVIRNALELASDEKSSPLAKEDLNQGIEAADQLLALVSNIVTAYNIDEGTFGFEPRSVDADRIVSDLVAQYTIRANKKGVRLVYNDSYLPKVKANEMAIREVIRQLLDNALKFAKKEIKVFTHIKEGMIWFNIIDDGEGMTKSELNKLFKKFSHTSYTYTMNHGGLGLGLYIVKRLTEGFDGKVMVTSDRAKGTRVGVAFWVVPR